MIESRSGSPTKNPLFSDFLLALFAISACLGLILAMSTGPGQAKLIIDLENPNLAKMPVAIPDFVSSSAGPVTGSALASVIRNDLYLTGLFQIIESGPTQGFKQSGEPDLEAWSRTGAQALILGSFQVSGDDLIVEARLYDLALGKLELGKRFTAKIRDHRRVVHVFGDRVMEKLTGVPGCFSTRIAFVSEGRSREIFSMDYDGHNLRQMTQTRTINLSPEWSPDGRGLIFTSYINRNPDLWRLDLQTMQLKLVSGQPGINASARYSPDGGAVALSLSAQGIPKIFIITPQGNIIKRLTNGRGNDISPSWSPDGNFISFTSDQAGSPQIYVVPVNGGEPSRLTFSSNYNTDPDWSPRGDLLAFTARIEGRFQICTMRTDGKDFRVLTQKGSSQDPSWSPDGRMIAFTSNRTGQWLIYVMDARGEIQVPVSSTPAKFPAWSRNPG